MENTMDSNKQSLSFRKLYEREDEEYFTKILLENRNRVSEWEECYPFHWEWIGTVIEELKSGRGRRIAFGGFFKNDSTDKEVLCSSVIIKKSEFTSYLEIKNLLVFKDDLPQNCKYSVFEIQAGLINYIKQFAEHRGYSKLVTELTNKNDENKELVAVLTKNAFNLSGSLINKFLENDFIGIYSCDINPICGQDPYDNIGITQWIMGKYINGTNFIHKTTDIYDSDENVCKVNVLSFHCGKKYSDVNGFEHKFNSDYRVIIIPETVTRNNQFRKIKYIRLHGDEKILNKLFIFNFSHDTDITELRFCCYVQDKREDITIDNTLIFSSLDLANIVDNDKDFLKKQRRCNIEDIGGILLVSNPNKFDYENYLKNVKKRKSNVYIKLGSYGDNITTNDKIVLAYYNTKDTENTRLYIWGIAGIMDPSPAVIYLKELRNDDRQGNITSGVVSNGKLLMKFIKEDFYTESGNADHGKIETEAIWDDGKFDLHNIFNATDCVIPYTISSLNILGQFTKNDNIFQRLSDDKIIYLDDFPTINSYLEENYKKNNIRSVFDFYLNKNEVAKIEKEIFKRKPHNLVPETSGYKDNLGEIEHE